jgi:uncharacterized protein (DUF3084 family)
VVRCAGLHCQKESAKRGKRETGKGKGEKEKREKRKKKIENRK